MKIAILGAGRVGSVLGRRWAAAGQEVAYGSRDPAHARFTELLADAGPLNRADTVAGATADAEIIVLAAPWSAARSLLEQSGDLTGKVVIDCINPLNAEFSGLDTGDSPSSAEALAAAFPHCHVVKAFNTASTATMADPDYGGQSAAMFFCGDDPDAKQKVRQLIELLGFEPVDAGPLARARYLEHLAMLYIHLAVHEGWGSSCAFKILRKENDKK